jgi:hypothetical protein
MTSHKCHKSRVSQHTHTHTYRLRACVCVCVCVCVFWLLQCLPTHNAHTGFSTCVYPHVSKTTASVWHRLPTNITHKVFLHMQHKWIPMCKYSATCLLQWNLFSSMQPVPGVIVCSENVYISIWVTAHMLIYWISMTMVNEWTNYSQVMQDGFVELS